MKIVLMMIIAFSFINAQTKVQISNLELSKHQVLDILPINNNLYIVSYGGQGTAKLDIYDIENKSIRHDVLKNTDYDITFGNSNLFKDKKHNLWIGDVNKLLKISENEEIFNLYKGINLPDSTFFEIKSITEDDLGNLYFLKRNSKNLIIKEENGTTYKVLKSDLEIIMFDGEKLESLQRIEEIGPFVNDIYYFKDKLYLSMLILGDKYPKLYTFDLNTQKFEQTTFSIPTVVDIPELSWEEAKFASIENIFELNNELFFYIKINANLSSFNCFAKFNESLGNFEYFSLPRNEEDVILNGINSYFILDDKIICSEDVSTNTEKSFYEFQKGKFKKLKFESNFQPYIITNSEVRSEIISRDLKFESGEYSFRSNFHIDNIGNLYAGTAKGLIYIESFIQPKTSSVENQNQIVKSIPSLSNVISDLYLETIPLIKSYKLRDINARILLTNANINSNNLKINLENFAAGVYFMELETTKSRILLNIKKN